MQPALPLPVRINAPRRPGHRLRALWAWLARDADDAWLIQADDLADIERRLKQRERGRPERFAPLPP